MEKKYIDMGSVGMHPKGAYDASVTYCKLQLVTHGGNTYLSKADGNIGHEPVGEDEWWSLLVDAKSAHDGAQSAQEAATAANAAAKTANDKAAEAAKAAESVTTATAGLQAALDKVDAAATAATSASASAQAQASRAQEAAEQGEALNLQLTDTLRKAKAEVDKAVVINNTATANEQERVKAEHERAETETQRASNETNRTEAENTRGNDEKLRAEAEARRVANEKLRVASEQERADASQQAVMNANTAADSANTAAEKANGGAEKVSAAVTAASNVNATLADDGTLTVTDRNGESKSVKVGEGEKVNQLVTDMKETKDAVAQNAADIAELKENVKDYYVGENDEVTGDPHFKNCKGNKDFLGEWHPFLIDHTDNTGEATHPVGQLMDNDHFRFVTGAFAPTVGITEEMRAACDVQLYTDAEHTTPLTLKNGVVVTDKAGAHPYDATEVYNSLGLVDLYDGEGNKVRQLLPWETTETKYSVMIGRYDTLYPVDRQTGESGKVLSGVFKRQVRYDGIDTGNFPLLGTALAPCLVTTVGNKTRNFFFAYAVGDANTASGASSAGADMCSMFDREDRTYPRHSLNQTSDMQYARANNADVNAPVPFAEGGYHAINTFTLCMELLYGTKYLHDKNLFGSGISSNDSCASADDWMNNGGVRVREKGTTDWTYKKWGDQTPFGVKSDMSKVGFSNFVNQEKPKEQCMESQMAASWAVEFGIAEDTEYEAYGQTYRYRNVTGVKGLADGVMSCNVYRIKTGTCMGYKAADSKVEYDCELCLRLSLVHGMNLSGDVFGYWGGGMEMVGTGKQQENTIQDKIKNAYIDFYLEPKQKNWLMENNTILSDFKTFAFEGVYAKIGTFGPPILGGGYFKKRMGLTPYKTENGGNIDSYQCCYGWTEPYWLDRYGQRVRIAVRLRGYANIAYCSPRFLYAHYSAAPASVFYGGSAQCRIVQ
jgi:hypothetical protein